MHKEAKRSKVGICRERALLIEHKPPLRKLTDIKGATLSHGVVKMSAKKGQRTVQIDGNMWK